MKLAIIGGTFDDNGGRRSGYVEKLAALLPASHIYRNGGYWSLIETWIAKLGEVDAVLWFADIPNDKPKLVEDLKRKWPKLLLVTSKRNLEGEYSLKEVVQRALKIKSNLIISMTGERSSVKSTILDPLGSIYCNEEPNVQKVATVLLKRLQRLMEFTRVGSEEVGPKIAAPEEPEFYALVREQAERFHEIIHGVGHERMMGNASFRCARGFPSVRFEKLFFVSRRDIDKRFIGPDNFVAVDLDWEDDPKVRYYGSDKPSVDTPIQRALYRYYINVKYMLHSHTYIEGAPMTAEPVPCGALEEADLVFAAHPNHAQTNFAINLRGHGSIFLADSVEALRNVAWIPRPEFETYPGRSLSARMAVTTLLQEHGGSMPFDTLSRELTQRGVLGFGVETGDVVSAMVNEGTVEFAHDQVRLTNPQG